MMQMIPFLNVCPSLKDVGLPPTPFGCDLYDMTLIDELSGMQDLDFDLEKLISSDFSAYEDSYFGSESFSCGGASSKSDMLGKVLRYDCKWSGCDPECAKTHGTNIGFVCPNDIPELMCPNDMYSQTVHQVEDIQPYTPDNDHCYYATATKQTVVDTDDKMDVLKNIPTPPCTSDSPSETSSEDEVDVVTVPEEKYHPPVMPRYDHIPRRSSRTPRLVKKMQRTQQSQLSAKSLKAAMKRTRMQSIRRPYRRRKVRNSVETTPSSSMPSSAHSSRCNSDNEDVDKRRTHNSSERKRREAQRTALQNLRVVIPDLQGAPKAPKVLILNTATSLVRKLKQNKQTLKDLKYRELQKRNDLLAKLNKLCMKFKLK